MHQSHSARVNFTDVLGKLDEMRAVFLIGARSLPLLEDLLKFVREISPLLDEISQSLSFTTAKMPTAASQLESVTQATELATTEILNLVDNVLGEVQTVRDESKAADACRVALIERDTRFLLALGDAADAPAVREALEAWRAEGEEVSARWQAHYEAKQARLNSVRDHMNDIMMALQVQDITAQQLASVNHLIESVRVRMAEIFERLRQDVEVEIDDLADLRASQSRFDPTAKYNPKGDHQHRADHVMHAYNTGDGAALAAAASPVEAGDIDALFGDAPVAPPVAQASQPADAADIDALFAAAAPEPEVRASEPASQDDIDALFG